MTAYDREPGYDRYGPVDPQMYGSGYDRGAYDRGAYDRGNAGSYDRGNAYDRGSGYGGAPRPLANNNNGNGYPYEIPYRPQPQQGMGYDNSPNAIGDSFGGFGPVRPLSGGSRCDEADNFKQMGVRQKVRRQYVRRVLPAQTLVHCQRECIDAKDFVCRSFNYRESALSYDSDSVGSAVIGVASRERERDREAANCELSDRDTRELDMQNPQMFDGGSFDYYERSNGRSNSDGECLDGGFLEWSRKRRCLDIRSMCLAQCLKRATRREWSSRCVRRRVLPGAFTPTASTIGAFSAATVARRTFCASADRRAIRSVAHRG